MAANRLRDCFGYLSRSKRLGHLPFEFATPSMSDPHFLYTHTDDKPTGSSSSSFGPEFKRGYHVLDRTSYLPLYQAPHAASAVSPELPRSAFPPNNWPADASIQTQRFATAAQFDSPPFPLPPTLRWSPIPSHATNNSPPHFGYNANPGAHHLVSEHRPRLVVMPTGTGVAQFSGRLIGAHTSHYDASSGFARDNYTVEYPRITPTTIGTPIVPTYLGAGASSDVDPVFASDPTLRWSPGYAITAYRHGPQPDSTLNPSPPGNFDSTSYHSPHSTPSFSNNHSFASPRPPSEMSNQIPSQPITTASIEQFYTLTVSSGNIEFPYISGAGEMPFFQCFWESCGIWITSDKEAVKDHLARAHGVVFNGQTADSACCKWVGCSSSSQKSTLVRHFRTHLGLKWLCSVCKGEYTRPDSVKWHGRKKPQCQSAQAISYPSAAAYRVNGINGNTVTLTKILQP
ncbi:hypothetical protein OG21DRAFT_135676 [Imleria badia]|nr:hypothetical protein OG21DRAFT_135676 [Imleria badia]